MNSYRFGTADDLDAVMRVMDEAFAPSFGEAWNVAQCRGILGLPGVSLLLAFAGDEPAGFALSRVVLDEAELLLLAVRPGFRRVGLGREMLLRAQEAVRIMGAQRFHLEVREGNEAIALYRRLGFKQVGRRPAYYRGRDGKVFDALSLSNALGRENSR